MLSSINSHIDPQQKIIHYSVNSEFPHNGNHLSAASLPQAEAHITILSSSEELKTYSTPTQTALINYQKPINLQQRHYKDTIT